MTVLLVRSSQALSTPIFLVGLDPSRGTQGFSSSPVLSVWALCQSCCTWLRVKKCALPGVLVCVICLLSIHRLPWRALSQHCIIFSPPQAPCYVLLSQSLFLWFPVLLHASLLPSPVIFHTSARPHWLLYLFCLSSLSGFFVQLPIPHFSPALGLCISCVLLAYPGPLILFLIPVSVQMCKVINAEEQTGFCSRKCWTIQGVGGAHSTTYNLEHCLYF